MSGGEAGVNLLRLVGRCRRVEGAGLTGGVVRERGQGEGGVGARAGLSARNREILDLRLRGLTLAEIGGRFGLTRQRVAQIVDRAGRPAAAEVLAARHAAEARRARARSGEVMERWRAGLTLARIASELRLTVRAVREVVDELASAGDRAARSRAQSVSRRPGYSDRELIVCVRRVAARVGGAPSAAEYARHARELGVPGPQTVAARLGGWRQALRAAGLGARYAIRGRCWRRWDEEACWRALESVSDQLGDPPRYARYQRLAAGRADLPSAATVRARLGAWSDIVVGLAMSRAAAAGGITAPDGQRLRGRAQRVGGRSDPQRVERQRRTLRLAYAELGERPFGMSEYERWRRVVHPDWPEAGVVARELGEGRWQAALAAAGVPSVSEQRRAAVAERRARVLGLLARGLPPSQIAARLDCKVEAVHRDLAWIRAGGGQPRSGA